MHPLVPGSTLPILAVLLSSLVLVTACSTSQDSAVANTKLSGNQLVQASDIEFDAELGESPWPEEGATTLAITESIQQTIKARYASDLPAFAMFTLKHMAVYWRIFRLIRRCRMNTSRASSNPVRAIRLGFAFQTATVMQRAKIKKVTGAAWQSN